MIHSCMCSVLGCVWGVRVLRCEEVCGVSVNNIHLPFLAALASALACRMKLIKHILEIYAATTLTPPFLFWGGRGDILCMTV